MNKYCKVITSLCILLLIAIAGYVFFLAQKIKTQEIRFTEIESKYSQLQTEIDNNADTISGYKNLLEKLEAYYSSRKTFDEVPLYNDYKRTIRSLIEKRINRIAPNQPLHVGKWFLSKMSFIGPTFAMVEYEDGHNLFSMLVQIHKEKNGYSFRVIK